MAFDPGSRVMGVFVHASMLYAAGVPPIALSRGMARGMGQTHVDFNVGRGSHCLLSTWTDISDASRHQSSLGPVEPILDHLCNRFLLQVALATTQCDFRMLTSLESSAKMS